uniref:Lysozyme protein 8 n=1 Tax=Wuchereria bancrofti TaxID=6293 RepID=A0A1I8EMM9_WUCBA
IVVDSKLKVPGNYGQAIDITTYADQSVFRCLFQAGFTAAFIRAYMSNRNGTVDINSVSNIYNAASVYCIAEGMGTEIYVEPQPCATKSGSEQFVETYTFLTMKGIAVRTIWIKITSPINWPNNQTANIDFINKFILCAWKHGLLVGIYTNWYDWEQIIAGQITPNQGQIRLNDATPPTFVDFRPFGGFNAPMVKQYVKNMPVCGICASLNVYVKRRGTEVLPGNMRANVTVDNLPVMLPIVAKSSKKQLESKQLEKKATIN